MAVQLILVQFVEVRILVGQRVAPRDSEGFCFFWTRAELARASGQENKTRTAKPGAVTWVMQSADGSPEAGWPQVILVGELFTSKPAAGKIIRPGKGC